MARKSVAALLGLAIVGVILLATACGGSTPTVVPTPTSQPSPTPEHSVTTAAMPVELVSFYGKALAALEAGQVEQAKEALNEVMEHAKDPAHMEMAEHSMGELERGEISAHLLADMREFMAEMGGMQMTMSTMPAELVSLYKDALAALEAGQVDKAKETLNEVMEHAKDPAHMEMAEHAMGELERGEISAHLLADMREFMAEMGGMQMMPTASTTSAETSGSHLPLNAFAIKVEPLGHWHIYKPKKLLFTVTETATGQGKAGLKPAVQIARVGSSSVSTRTLEKDQVKEEGNGVYSLEYTPGDMDAYAFVFRFTYEDMEFVSAPIPTEVVRDGEEGIKVEAKGTQYVYQVRYNWVPGHAHASDTDKVKMVFEIMRGVQEGSQINWEQPYRNTFNHIVDADHPEVMVETHDGKVKEELHPVYKGKGIYEAERIFSVAEVGEGADYDVRFQFTDPYNDAKVTHVEHYELHVSAPH